MRLEATYQSFLSNVPMPSCVSYNCLLRLCLVMSSEPATLQGVDLPNRCFANYNLGRDTNSILFWKGV